jgi:hypothetical protein
MAVSKIVKVNSLYATIAYCTRNEKTDYGLYVSSYNCNMPFVARQFNDINATRRQLSNRPFSVEAWMIFQSFAVGEITHEKAHELGVEFAKRYLGNDHQYFVTTHIDAGHVHNHIVFNATRFTDYKSFDSRTKHIIQDLRKTNDELCEENNLSVIREPKGKGISQREFYARKNKRSYKARLERLIDKAIDDSNTYEDFLAILDRNIEVRFGATLSFKFPEQERFTRLSKLGVDYSENSIKYRIENKTINIKKLNTREIIDTSDSKFLGKENAGLRRWATEQNIDTLSQMSHAMHTNQITSDEYQNRQKSAITRMTEIGKRLSDVDKRIAALETYLEQETIYRSSFRFLQEYKKSKNKETYKKQHYADFKAYDKAKAIMASFKTESGKIPRPETIMREMEELKVERTLLYTDYQNVKEEIVLSVNRPAKQNDQKIRHRREQNELD